MSGPNDPTRHRADDYIHFFLEENPSFAAGAPCEAPSEARSLPRRFGDYELLEEVGRGGMGVVYRARQRSLARVVALKMIRDSRLAAGQTVDRFYKEARAAAALDHPGIVPIYEVGQSDGQHYFTMALVEGPNLEDAACQDGLPSPQVAAVLVAAVADAVEYAHQHGVIHRDLKPENILLEGRLSAASGPGRPRVTDFGLAKHTAGESGLTAPGEILGTPSYMAPEQARGDHRAIVPGTDIHALGGILYFLLTGRPPFSGLGALGVMRRVMEEAPPPPRQVKPQVPAGLETICLKCLEKDPTRRYATAGEVAEKLRAWTSRPGSSSGATIHLDSESGSPASPGGGEEAGPEPKGPSGRLRWRRALVAAGVLALLVAVGIILTAPLMRLPNERPGEGEVPVKVKGHKVTYRDFTLKVEMTGGSLDRAGVRILNEGEEVAFRIEVERDAYVGIWNVAPDGTIRQLFPNEDEPDNLFRADEPRMVPRADLVLTAVPAGGTEQVWVVASTRRWELPEGRRKGPYLIFETAEEQRRWEQVMERGFERRKREPMAVAELVLTYRVSPR
jgi:tRNA A-37 threonylcarbamoyl transferase component Bud32